MKVKNSLDFVMYFNHKFYYDSYGLISRIIFIDIEN